MPRMSYDPTDSGMVDDERAEGQQPGDEEMLETVRQGMGKPEGGPPPGSGMKWMDLQEDQDALEANPTPENMQAFVEYWGEENVPESLGGPTGPEGGTGQGGGRGTAGGYEVR